MQRHYSCWSPVQSVFFFDKHTVQIFSIHSGKWIYDFNMQDTYSAYRFCNNQTLNLIEVMNEENCSQNYQTTRPDHNLFTLCKCNVPMKICMYVQWTAQCKRLFLWKDQYLSCGERRDTNTVCHYDRTVTFVGISCTCCHANEMVLCTRDKRVWLRLTLRWRFQKSKIKM